MADDATWADAMPGTYDRLLGPMLFAPCAAYLAQTIVPSAPRRVLELAAGTGIATAALLDSLPDAEITATDLSVAMVDFGRDRLPRARWSQADAAELPFPDAGFDLVVCQFGLMFLPDRQAGYREACRVLVPGGTVVHVVWDAVPANTFAALLTTAMRTVLGEQAPDFLDRVPFGYHDTDRMRADVIAGGLEVEAIERFVLPGEAASAAAIVDGLCLGTPLRFALASGGDLERRVDAIRDELRAELGDGPVAGDLAAYRIEARRPVRA